MDIKQRFGLAMRIRRKELGITQEELAMRINVDGMDGDEKVKYADQSYISRIELGQANITLETVEQIAGALGVEAREMFG